MQVGPYFNKVADLYNTFYTEYLRVTASCLLGLHCVKSVPIQSYSGPHFLAFGLNTERYGVSLHIRSECGENADKNNSEYGHFSRSVGLISYFC